MTRRVLPPELRAEIKLDTPQYRRLRAATTTVPSMDADEYAARVSLTLRQLRRQHTNRSRTAR